MPVHQFYLLTFNFLPAIAYPKAPSARSFRFDPGSLELGSNFKMLPNCQRATEWPKPGESQAKEPGGGLDSDPRLLFGRPWFIPLGGTTPPPEPIDST